MQKALLAFSAMAIVLFSCTKVTNGGSTPASGSTDISPNANVPDPEGTVELKMRNADNGRTYLDGFLYITSANNFRGGKIAALGPMKGLGNVARIPSSGWAEEVAVTPGNGYVVYYGNDKFYRIFVEDFTLAAETEGIIGAAIKYQAPFYGLDEAPILENAQLTIPAEGIGNKTIKLKNTSIIPLEVKLTSYNGDDFPEGLSISDIPYDAPLPRVTADLFNNTLILSSESNTSTSQVKTVYTLTTKYNKSVKLEITQEAAKAYGHISPSSDYARNGYPCTGVTSDKAYLIDSNIPINGFTVSSDKDWCKPVLVGYTVTVTTDNNYGESRSATITLYSKDGEKFGSTTLKQNAASLRLSRTSTTVGAAKASFDVWAYFEPFRYSDIKVAYDNAIISSVEEYGNVNAAERRFTFYYNANISDQKRSTVITFTAGSEGISADFTLTQNAASLTVNKTTPVLFDKNQGNLTYYIYSDADWTAQSSASWCTTSRNGNNLTIRVEPTTVDRKATITFPGFSAKLEVDQSKYAVGDNYSEGNVKGTVLYIDDNIRLIYKEVGEAQWSTENVQIGANSTTDGMYNMNVVKAISGWKNLYPAFALCDALNTNGVTGWYLPACQEGQINSFARLFSSEIWTSTEQGSNYAYYIRINYHDYSNKPKSSTYNVTAVRQF